MDILCSYSTTKGALRTLTKNNANTLRRHRIRVNGINWVGRTRRQNIVQAAQGSPDDWLKRAEQASPFGRLLKPNDVAKLVTYLLLRIRHSYRFVHRPLNASWASSRRKTP